MVKKILSWILKIVLGLTLALLTFGTIKQWRYDSNIKKEYKPDGKFSDIGNNKIHFKSSGSGDLTFVLIAGLGETMNTWSTIEPELRKRGHVFMYDRSGLGHSEAGILPRSVDNITIELNTVLKSEQIQKPYILIGHSVGGFVARYFAKKYPEHVAGLFLIDPYTEMSKEKLGEWPASYKMMNWSFRNLSWSGIPYFLLPNPPHPTYKTSTAIKTYGQEAVAETISLQEFAKLDKGISDLPMYLVTADKTGSKYNDIQKEWHRQIFKKYVNEVNRHVLIKSSHHIHIEQPELIIQALDEFLIKLKSKN